MILKNLINLFNLFNLFLFICFIFLLFKFLNSSNIREKFFLFIINMFILVGIGFYYNLDGMVMLFFMSELVVILIFITTYSQLYTHYRVNSKKNLNVVLFLFFILNIIILYNPKLISYKNYYNVYNITLNDFYYFYSCYFEKQVILTLLTILIITVYSLFFIVLFYSLKKKQDNQKVKKKKFNLLKKQNIIHQNNFNSKIRIFKNNISKL